MVASIAMPVHQSISLGPSKIITQSPYKGEVSLEERAQNHLLPLLC